MSDDLNKKIVAATIAQMKRHFPVYTADSPALINLEAIHSWLGFPDLCIVATLVQKYVNPELWALSSTIFKDPISGLYREKSVLLISVLGISELLDLKADFADRNERLLSLELCIAIHENFGLESLESKAKTGSRPKFAFGSGLLRPADNTDAWDDF